MTADRRFPQSVETIFYNETAVARQVHSNERSIGSRHLLFADAAERNRRRERWHRKHQERNNTLLMVPFHEDESEHRCFVSSTNLKVYSDGTTIGVREYSELSNVEANNAVIDSKFRLNRDI